MAPSLRACCTALVAATATAAVAPPLPSVYVLVNTTAEASQVVLPHYLSFNVDSGSLYNLFDWRDPVLIQLVRNLAAAAPTQVRVGGGAADTVWFTGPGGAAGNCSVPDVDPTINTCVDAGTLASLCAFGTATGAGIVWDLNVALRRPAGGWNSSNAAALFDWLVSAPEAAGCPVVGWQLGNEVEDFYKRRPVLNISGSALAADYTVLAELLASPPYAGRLPTAAIFGPDACCEERLPPPVGSWLAAFSAGAGHLLSGLTIHDYPIPRFANDSCEPALFTSATAFASLRADIAAYAGYAAPALSAGVPLILGETATSAHGGCDGLSNRFVAGFTFWYELGAAAESGAVQMNRQDLAGYSSTSEPSNYGLLGPPGWSSGPLGQPHPDYFSALLFKQLAGKRVLGSAPGGGGPTGGEWWDAHVWCAATGGGGLVVTYYNMGGEWANVSVGVAGAGGGGGTVPVAVTPRVEYVLTAVAAPPPPPGVAGGPPPPTVFDDAVYLNGARLATGADGGLPVWPLPGVVVGEGGGAWVVPPWSYGAVALPNAGVAACV